MAVGFLVLALVLVAPVLGQESIPEPTQRTDAPFRLFRTQNVYTLLKLDTRTGEVAVTVVHEIGEPFRRADQREGFGGGREAWPLYARGDS
jgi:hypothetical protein